MSLMAIPNNKLIETNNILILIKHILSIISNNRYFSIRQYDLMQRNNQIFIQ